MKVISNQEAFLRADNEQIIPLDVSNLELTRNWFRQRNQTTWSTFLYPKFSGVKMNWPLRMIQIGVFEGADLVWCLRNILTHPDSWVLGVDPWADTGKINAEEMQKVHLRALKNTAPFSQKVNLVQGRSQDVLRDLIEQGDTGTFDLIVIDGDHNAIPVLNDALLSYDLLKPGGWMVFDDVRNKVAKKDHVVDGIRLFLESHDSLVKLEWQHRYVDCYSKI